MTSPKTGTANPQRELEALVRESERLRRRSSELLADMDTLRQRMGQLYIDLAPLDRRLRERRKRSGP
jgi:predicted  nucleic acid-binding Zn-ribbon protein